ncbi:putative DNA-binding WGR domain protein [Cytobacillus purgationiresistens]|uniref:DNA-binding WGR domain protein n=1 Tax=Cytobacillus purgationiresistens TaxID=863449 RepID=A0ABU0ANG6_9BACI|nr:putative DNA-binding WGR domain protein [Cytobacillus purgationiresistens]
METLLKYKDNISDKFWKMNMTGSSYTVTYGKVGTVGAVKTKEFESEEACQKEANKLIQSKLKKGYVLVDSSEHLIKESSITDLFFGSCLRRLRKKVNIQMNSLSG